MRQQQQPLSDYDDQYDDGYGLVGEQRFEEAGPRPERRFAALLLSVGAMVVFAGGLWFAYYEGTRHAGPTMSASSSASGDTSGVPLIRADQQPDKVKPQQPGGMNIPDQNVSLYNERPGVAPVERLLPPPEKPMPKPAPAPEPPPQAAAPPAPQVAALPPPAAVQTQPISPVKPAAPAASPKPAARPAAPPANEAARTEAAKSGPVQIRLASVRTPDEARTAWARMKRDNADLLGNLRGVAVRTDLGDKGIYYRIEAGPLQDGAVAARLCGELKQRGLGCILAR